MLGLLPFKMPCNTCFEERPTREGRSIPRYDAARKEEKWIGTNMITSRESIWLSPSGRDLPQSVSPPTKWPISTLASKLCLVNFPFVHNIPQLKKRLCSLSRYAMIQSPHSIKYLNPDFKP